MNAERKNLLVYMKQINGFTNALNINRIFIFIFILANLFNILKKIDLIIFTKICIFIFKQYFH